MPAISGMLSLASGSVENNFALAAARIDFSLIKIEAPSEYQPLGLVLSPKRRKDAEYGVLHRIARRLGALFDQIIPTSPGLIKAYGQRVSEIINTAGINPQGSSKHGAFLPFVGADASTLWASTTSGPAAIAMHLLACLIANLFDDVKAVSIWVELVEERRKEIEESFVSNSFVSEQNLYSVTQDITRKDLGLWDNSARAWQRSADEAKMFNKEQMRQIVRNLNIPHCGGDSMYKRIITAWIEAMSGIEQLLGGAAQRALTKSVPLALMAWHLFPDLIVLSTETKHITFKDPLFSPSTKLTLGEMSDNRNSSSGTKWSLALSHYKFYGGAARVNSQEDQYRVTIQQACIIALGALLATWKEIAYDIQDMKEVAAWFQTLYSMLTGQTSFDRKWVELYIHGYSFDKRDDQYIPSSVSFKKSKNFSPLDSIFPALDPLFQAAWAINQATSDIEVSESFNLYRFGQRRQKFLNNQEPEIPAFFGLRYSRVLLGLREPNLDAVERSYLREIARASNLKSVDWFIVRTVSDNSQFWEPETIEISPIIPVNLNGKEDMSNELEGVKQCDHKWLGIFDKRTGLESSFSTKRNIINKVNLSDQKYPVDQNYSGDETGDILVWHNCPISYLPTFNTKEKSLWARLKDLRAGQRNQNHGDAVLLCGLGSRSLGLFTVSGAESSRDLLISKNRNMIRSNLKSIAPVGLRDSRNLLTQTNRDMLQHFLCRLKPLDESDDLVGLITKDYTDSSLYDTACAKSLYAISCAIDLYTHLSGATISTLTFSGENSLGQAKWARELRKGKPPKHCEAFSCVLHLDSGTMDVSSHELQSAIAISRENNIFVIGSALEDPFYHTENSREEISRSLLKRITGNVGYSGTSILVGPKSPMVREQSNSWQAIAHAPYDYRREDHFRGTTMHLHFTDWSQPISLIDREHTISSELNVIESIVSMQDKGTWIADLDLVLPRYGEGDSVLSSTLESFRAPCTCQTNNPDHMNMIFSVDSWNELLDPFPRGLSIFRAHGNWAARLAAERLLRQMNHQTFVVSPENCVRCFARRVSKKYNFGNIGSIFLID